MTNNQIEQKLAEIIAKYLGEKGNVHKKLFEIMDAENIKFREVASENCAFVGAFTKANSSQYYIMVNKNIDNQGRKNFTIAHELGHYFLLHQLQNNTFFCGDDAINEESQVANQMEQEANHFASCFLMPEAKVRGAFLALLQNSWKAKNKSFLLVDSSSYGVWAGICGTLTKRYGVSEAALRYRLMQLSLAKFSFQGNSK